MNTPENEAQQESCPIPDYSQVKDPAGVVLSLILAQACYEKATRVRFVADDAFGCTCEEEVGGKWYWMQSPGEEPDFPIENERAFESFMVRLARAVEPGKEALSVGDVVRLSPGHPSKHRLPAPELTEEYGLSKYVSCFQIADYRPGQKLILVRE